MKLFKKHHPIKFYKRHWKWTVPLTVVLLFLAGGGTYAFIQSNKPKPVEPTKKVEIKPPELPHYFSKLTGREVSELLSLKPVTGVMIENSPEARPQSGLYDADLVFESVAEGGITRFLALYQESEPKEIGPIRSVRIHFANLAVGYDAGLAHVGGADSALNLIRSNKDLDEFANGGSYWRSTERYAPHNVYTSFDKLNELNRAKGFSKSDFIGFSRKADEPKNPADATSIYIPISAFNFDSQIKYQPETNSYLRFMAGKPHLDANGKQISPKVVVVLNVDHNTVSDTNGYRYPQILSSGSAIIYQDGTKTEATWAKKDATSPLKLTDASGNDMKLNPGQTWVTIIPTNNKPVIEEPIQSN